MSDSSQIWEPEAHYTDRLQQLNWLEGVFVRYLNLFQAAVLISEASLLVFSSAMVLCSQVSFLLGQTLSFYCLLWQGESSEPGQFQELPDAVLSSLPSR